MIFCYCCYDRTPKKVVIANNAGITVSRLKQLNNLRSDKLNIGQKLKVL